MKCRNFISGLHILAKNQIPESILHADFFSNILHGVSQYLLDDNVYTLLYGTILQYEHCQEFHLNNVLYMTISLPLKHHRAPIMSLYGLFHIIYQLTCQTGRTFLPLTPNLKSATNTYCYVMICSHY